MARRRSSSWGWGYSYTSAGEVEASARKAVADAKKKGLTYHPVVIQGNKIAKTWWGKSWCENLERYADYANRLPRGRSYVRHNAVVDLQIEKGVAHAKVQGSSLYRVEIHFDPLNPKTEKELGKACSEQIQNVEELIGGKFPETLKGRFLARGGLFPTPREIHFNCSCPDWAYMCKHVAAVMYGIGARLDDEPLGFFDLRGISTDDFVAKAVKNKVESMLDNAARKSSRIIEDVRLEELFGLEIGGTSEAKPEKPAGKRPGRQAAGSERKTNDSMKKTETPKKRGRPAAKAVKAESTAKIQEMIAHADYPEKTKRNLMRIADSFSSEVFGNAQVMRVLDCSAPTATAYLKKLREELELIVPVEGQGKGKYRFIEQ